VIAMLIVTLLAQGSTLLVQGTPPPPSPAPYAYIASSSQHHGIHSSPAPATPTNVASGGLALAKLPRAPTRTVVESKSVANIPIAALSQLHQEQSASPRGHPATIVRRSLQTVQLAAARRGTHKKHGKRGGVPPQHSDSEPPANMQRSEPPTGEPRSKCAAPPLSKMYATELLGMPATNDSMEAWHRHACPWEEVRHSGYFNHFADKELAFEYATRHSCADTDREGFARRLAGRRFFFFGDSVMRQFSQAFLCRLRASLRIVEDGVPWWKQWPTNKWGHCSSYSSSALHPGGLQHCYMGSGCVSFEGDVRVCYQADNACSTHFAVSGVPFRGIARNLRKWGTGTASYMIMTNGMHRTCTRRMWENFRKVIPSFLTWTLKNTSMRRDQFAFVYKELDATHFPARSGLYQANTFNHNRSKWFCGPVKSGDPLPPSRQLELQIGLPTVEYLNQWANTHILRTFDAGLADGPRLHATYAHKPGTGNHSIDCLHWMLPGVPDAWVEQLVALLPA